MRFGPYFAMLNAEFEHRQGEIVTKAYLDPAGEWTGPGGITRNADGSLVREGQTWTEAEALQIYADQRAEFAEDVARLIDGKVLPLLKQHQFDALGVLAWNIGIDLFSTSTTLEKVNAGRFEEAAEAFLRFFRLTLEGGERGPDGKPARDPNGNIMAKGVEWFKASRGLLRRQASSALMFSAKHWRDAAAPDQIVLSSVPVWTGKRWYDEVRVKSEWKDILAKAKDDPLPIIHGAEPEPEEPEMADPLAGVPANLRPHMPADYASLSSDEQTMALNAAMTKALKAPPASRPASSDAITQARLTGKPGTKPLSPNTKRIEEIPYGVKDPAEVGAKPMEEAGRYRKAVNVEKAKSGVGWGTVLSGGATAAAASKGMSSDAKSVVDATAEAGNTISANFDIFIVVALAAGAGMIIWGLVSWWWNRNARYKAEQEAQQLLY